MEEKGCEKSISEQMHQLMHKALSVLDEILEGGTNEEKIKAISFIFRHSNEVTKLDKFMHLTLLWILSNIKTQPEKTDPVIHQEIMKFLKNLKKDGDILN